MQKKIIVVTGHYGSGKTNFAINYAVWLKQHGHNVVLADIDIVNPYFRSADFLNNGLGIPVIAPPYANSNLEMPVLSGEVDAAIEQPASTLVLDVGGDDAGAFALGRYAPRIQEHGYDMLYVTNAYRPMTATPAESLQILREIELVSRLKATGIVNNSNLGWETTLTDLAASVDYAQKLSELAGIPVVQTTIPEFLKKQEHAGELPHPFYVDIFVKTPWADAPMG